MYLYIYMHIFIHIQMYIYTYIYTYNYTHISVTCSWVWLLRAALVQLRLLRAKSGEQLATQPQPRPSRRGPLVAGVGFWGVTLRVAR